MAGSFNHCLDEHGNYRGPGLLENVADMGQAIEMMAFMLLYLQDVYSLSGPAKLHDAETEYYKCLRGEQQWPSFMTDYMGRQG